jgi:hypothetical protein
MNKHNQYHNQKAFDHEKRIREQTHSTRPPRLEGVVKEGMMQPVRKEKQMKTRSTKGTFK